METCFLFDCHNPTGKHRHDNLLFTKKMHLQKGKPKLLITKYSMVLAIETRSTSNAHSIRHWYIGPGVYVILLAKSVRRWRYSTQCGIHDFVIFPCYGRLYLFRTLHSIHVEHPIEIPSLSSRRSSVKWFGSKHHCFNTRYTSTYNERVIFQLLYLGVGGNPECVNINGTIQQVYPDPRFSVDAFLVFLIFLVCVSWVAFILLSNLKRFFKIDVYYEDFQEDLEHSHHNQYSKSFVVVLLIMEAVICSLTNGILTSIQPYSVLYYGNLTYHFVVTLGAISSPVGCILTSIPMKKERLPLFVSVFVGLCASLYILLSALASPNPLITFSFGSFLIVLTWIVNNMSFSYARALISKMFRSQNDSHRLLFVGGIFTQIGSAIGAFLMFYLVNYVNLFKSYEPCKQ